MAHVIVRFNTNHLAVVAGYKPNDVLTQVHSSPVYLHREDVREFLATVFRAFNAEWYRIGSATRNMSVGDVIDIIYSDGETESYACAMTGWDKVVL